MKEISFKLDPKEFRPTFKLGEFDVVFATGAIIPMFYMDDDTLRQEFHGRITIQDAVIWGIGGEVHGYVYRISDFHIGELTFKTLDVYVPYMMYNKVDLMYNERRYCGRKGDCHGRQQRKTNLRGRNPACKCSISEVCL